MVNKDKKQSDLNGDPVLLEAAAVDPLAAHVSAMADQTQAIDNLAASIDDLTELLKGVASKMSVGGLVARAFGSAKKTVYK